MKIVCLILMLFSMLILGAAGSYTAAEEVSKPRSTIRVDDLGDKIIVLGRLGQPLRKMMHIKGVWEKPNSQAKPDATLRLSIKELNGKLLSQPINFRSYDVRLVKQDGKKLETQPAAGDKWEIRAYETWSTYDHPQEYWDELGIPPHSPLGHDATQLIGIVKNMKN